MAEKQISNPAGALGYTDLRTKLWAIEAPFETSAAVTAARLVAVDTTGKVATAATDGTASLVLGFAPDAIGSGKVGGVVVAGIAENVPCNGAVAAGDILKRSVTTAGYVAATATPAAGEVIGVAINASSSNTVDVWICKAPALS